MAQRTAVAHAGGERQHTMTYEEFLAWSGEDTHAEWVNGEVIESRPRRYSISVSAGSWPACLRNIAPSLILAKCS